VNRTGRGGADSGVHLTELRNWEAFADDAQHAPRTGKQNQLDTRLGTRLDWVAIDHWNTEHPHIHILVPDAPNS
jgi:type IV secretory pathway VirD2 relaxase